MFGSVHSGRAVKRERNAATEAAEPRISDEASLGQVNHHDHVPARRLVRREHERHARGAQCRLEPEGTQRGVKQRRLLEAIAATPTTHDLVLQAFDVEPDGTTEQDVNIFEMDGIHVRREQSGERGVAGIERAVIADTGEIGGKVEGGHGEHAKRGGCVRNRYSADYFLTSDG